MTIPISYTFTPLRLQNVTISLTTASGAVLTNATVHATLYSNRSRFTPTTTPGTADTIFNNIAMAETPSGSGTYVGTVPETFNPLPATSGFVTVITAVDQSSNPAGTFEIPTIVDPIQNNIDLVTLDDVKVYLGLSKAGAPNNTDDDSILQLFITAFSQYVLNRTGITSFRQVSQYTEFYDGNGNMRLMLRNYPIQSLVSVTIAAYNVPLSTSTITSGVYIDDSKKSIAFRWSAGILAPPNSIYPYSFTYGQGNIQVVYTAGYSSVPYDLASAVLESCALNYRRKDWIDLASKALNTGGGGSGTTTYRSWAISPSTEMVLRYYSRYSRT